MKIKIECDLISQVETKRDSNKVEITLTNPIIEEYEDMETSDLVELIGRDETNELIKCHFMDYIAEVEDGELLKLSLKIAKEMSDRGINIEESI